MSKITSKVDPIKTYYSPNELEKMRCVDIEHINRDNLVDIQNVSIDTTLPPIERMENYLQQIKNPYCFVCGNVAVHLRFDPNGNDLKDRLKEHFINQKKASF